MRLEDFDFELPHRLIADRPCEPRDAARLLVIPASGGLQDWRVADLPGLLRPGDLLVFNDTKVIPARLVGRRGAASVELTLHRDLGSGGWRAFAKGARRLRVGDRIVFAKDFVADVAEKHPGGDVTLRFDLEGEAFRAALARHGAMPLPPYIKRPRGSDPRDHKMHAEWGVLSAETAQHIAAARRAGGRIVAVGTTSLRLLESAAAEGGEIRPFAGETRLYVLPGYRFRAIDLALTNFHLARSTLLMLVAALAGLDRIKDAYAHAVAAGYRFFSYGDACLIERPRSLEPRSSANVGGRSGVSRKR